MPRIRPETQIKNPGDPTKVLLGDGTWGSIPTVGAGYTHTQSIASAVWTINHNLGYVPNVRVEDSAGTVVEGDIDVVDVNTLTITFSAAFGGIAYAS